jgi:hypothetical protein
MQFFKVRLSHYAFILHNVTHVPVAGQRLSVHVTAKHTTIEAVFSVDRTSARC